MGGWGDERDISLKTGDAVMRALESRGHRATGIIAGPGLDQMLRTTAVDVAFLALHGQMGEDGRVQGLLEVMGIPYTGSGVLASALAMNKPKAKELFRLHNLNCAPGYTLHAAQLVDPTGLATLHGDLGFPCVVKPAHGGSSVGLSWVMNEVDLRSACLRALALGDAALVERWVPGREITVGVLDGEVLGSCEIDSAGPLLDFRSKYQGGARYHLPPRLSATRRLNIETMALTAYRALDCRGAARVDLRVEDEGNETVLEVNTLPGLTPVSLLPRIAAHAGLSFADLVERILKSVSCEASIDTKTRVVPTVRRTFRTPLSFAEGTKDVVRSD
jgi:D-alanine-D-alanine ligase